MSGSPSASRSASSSPSPAGSQDVTLGPRDVRPLAEDPDDVAGRPLVALHEVEVAVADRGPRAPRRARWPRRSRWRAQASSFGLPPGAGFANQMPLASTRSMEPFRSRSATANVVAGARPGRRRDRAPESSSGSRTRRAGRRGRRSTRSGLPSPFRSPMAFIHGSSGGVASTISSSKAVPQAKGIESRARSATSELQRVAREGVCMERGTKHEACRALPARRPPPAAAGGSICRNGRHRRG